jgi:anti-sigma factor RsiW
VTCEQSGTVLHGYLDGELDPLRSEEFERHLEFCSQCITMLEQQESLRGSLRAAKLYERAPNGLERKIKRNMANMNSDGQWSWVPIFRWIAASAAIILLVAITYLGGEKFLTGPSDTEQAAQTELVDAHIRSLQPGHLTDIVSTDQHTVKPWFAGKLNYVPAVRDFADNGFPLLGGRLDVLNGRSVAVLVYGRRKHYINVFVWPESKKGSLLPATGTRNGYQWHYLSAHDMEYCAISDVSSADLHELSELLRQ